MQKKSAPFLTLLVLVSSCAHSPSSGNRATAENLKKIISEFTEKTKRLDAFNAPYFNVEEDLSKFGDFASPAFFERRRTIYLTAKERLSKIRPEQLSEKDRVDYLIFKDDVDTGILSLGFSDELLAFNQMDNRLHAYIDDSSETLTNFPFDSVKHYDDFLKRSEDFPAYVDNQIALFRRGIRENIVLSCIAAKATLNSYKDGLEPEIEKNPFFRPVGFMPKSFSDSDRARLTEGFKTMVAERILPGFKKFDHFFKSEYIPNCRSTYGIGGLANGKKWYRYRIRSRTNLDLEPKAIHDLGIQEVKRIMSEMQEIQKSLGFKGSFRAFLKSLSDDPKYYFTSAKELSDAFEKTKELTATKIDRFFNLIPKTEYRLAETSNPEDAAGSYNQPTENIPYGRFIMNTKNLRAIPTYGVNTLLLHEAIPGHHFQLAIQFEMKDELSEFRRKIFDSVSFVEGWALYAEYLGKEMGMFEDPMQRLGNLNDEMLRAVRLVVDTGIHAFGWSQKRAIAYMTEHLASDPKDISNEANRYSVWPGQALGYKLGQLKIIELRKMAEKELGPKFDIRGFHRVVIGNGTIPLGVLENLVKTWIDKNR